MKTAYHPHRARLILTLFASLILITGTGCGLFESEDEKRGYSVGEQKGLQFYFLHAFRGTIPTSEGVRLSEDESDNRGDAGPGHGARRVITVRDAADPSRTLPELHFESEDTTLFEVEDYGCTPDESCAASTCPIDHERFDCSATDVYRVRLGLLREGVGRLIARDAEGARYDAVEVRVYVMDDE